MVTHLTDVQATLEALHAVSHPRTRVLIYSYSRLWQPLLRLAERLGMKYEQPPESWLPPEEIKSMLSLADFEVVRDDAHLVCPVRVPLLADLAEPLRRPPARSRRRALARVRDHRPARAGEDGAAARARPAPR